MARVLIVDDDNVSLQLLEMILRRDSHSVVTTTHSGETVDLIQRHHPDLIILNDMMPNMSGGELCRRIKSDPHMGETPVILMSAGLRVRDPNYVREAHADGVIYKPCLPAEIRELVNRYVRHN